jgi:uncharacterized surface protein with fasciclin (FAS1) repeats
MRFAQHTLAIASPILTIALTLGLLTSALSSVAQPTRHIAIVAPVGVEGTSRTGATLAPLAPSDTHTSATLAGRADISVFYDLVERAGLRTRLRRPTDSYTVFAPTNEALSHMAAPVRAALLNQGAPIVKSLARVHIVQGVITPDQLIDGREIETLEGRKLHVVRQADGSVLLDGVYRLHDGGQRTTNGIVYTIDQVVAP